MDKQLQNWKLKNKRDISQRLTWIRNKEEGIVLFHNDGTEKILVNKQNNLVFLHFVEEDPLTKEDRISDVMSLIDTSNPLFLHSIYAQAMFLSLLFVPEPKQLYMLGFGGGRIPMLLHHHLPELNIESSEQSQGVVSLLEMCFGIKTGKRINVATIDGKEHLQKFSPNHFDIILLDTFSGAGIHPNDLSSTNFYSLCKSRLSHHGVIATNLVSSSPGFDQKVKHFCASFRYVYSFNRMIDQDDTSTDNNNDNHIYFGSNIHDFSTTELSDRAIQVDEKYQFDFKLEQWVKMTKRQVSTF